jgi:hypothetical protein
MNYRKASKGLSDEASRLRAENAMLRQACENLVQMIAILRTMITCPECMLPFAEINHCNACGFNQKRTPNRPATRGPNPNPKRYPP